MSLVSEFYLDKLLSTKRGNNHGVFSNAKPIFVLAIIDAIADGAIVGNKILYENPRLKELYELNFSTYLNEGLSLYRANLSFTPYRMPFFHLNSESYYNIKWMEGVVPLKQALSPSDRYLSVNVDYAYLDDRLWDLLQNSRIREKYRTQMINHFFKK